MRYFIWGPNITGNIDISKTPSMLPPLHGFPQKWLVVGTIPFHWHLGRSCLAMASQSWKSSIQPKHKMAARDWVGFKNFGSENQRFPFLWAFGELQKLGPVGRKTTKLWPFFLFSAFGLVFNCQIGWLYSKRSCDIPWYFTIGFGPWSSLSLPIVHLRNFLTYLVSRWPRSWGGQNMPSLANLPTSHEQ